MLNHPEHLAGVNHGTITVTEITELAPSIVRITASLDHAGDRRRWDVPNPAIRLELPAVGATAGAPADDVGDAPASSNAPASAETRAAGTDQPQGDTVSRVYTVRAVRHVAAGTEIDIDVVRHGTASPVMQWLSGLAVGATVRIFGPRAHFCPDFSAAAGVPIGLFADETAIPALATILREWPAGHVGHAWVETPDEQVVADLPTHPLVEVHWLRRSDALAAPGTTGALVAAAQEFSEAHRGPLSVWACGEHGEMKQIRDHFRKDRGFAREAVVVFGYWRRHASSTEIDAGRMRRLERALERGESLTSVDEFADGE